VSLAPKLKEIVAANDVPINEMPPKNKLAIKVDTKPKDDTEKEELEEYFQSETDTDDEPSGRVRWHSCQSQIDAGKENRNPDQVLDADVFAKLSPLRCTPCRFAIRFFTQGSHSKDSKLLAIGNQESKREEGCQKLEKLLNGCSY
jgi:hypothetical protein